MGELAPVVLFVYNRLEHVKQVLSNLSQANLANETELIIYSDAAKSDNMIEDVERVRRYIDDFAQHNGSFKKIRIIKAKHNKGLANSIIEGVTTEIGRLGKIIVLEDDLLVSVDFLTYMNMCLDYYQDYEKVWAISGYSFPMKALKNYKNDIYVTGRGCSWGWATWKDRWETVDWNVEDYASIKYNFIRRFHFGRWGQDLPIMLDANIYGKNHSWAIRWCYAAFKQNKYTIYPAISRIINIGTDGTGTNYRLSINKYDTVLASGEKRIELKMVEENSKIRHEFSRKYMDFSRFIKWNMYWLLVKINLIKLK